MNRARDWLEQARWNLRHAQGSLDLEDYAWACFAAKQAAEEAIRLAEAILAFAVGFLEGEHPK